MKRGTRVHKPNRGEQEPFSRKLAQAAKEIRRLDADCKARIEAVERKAGVKIDAACAERDRAKEYAVDKVRELHRFTNLHRDFARVAPVLRSRSRVRRLWWGIRFGLWGVFGFED